MNRKKLSLLTAMAGAMAMVGINPERDYMYGKSTTPKPIKTPPSKEEQDIKIFKAEEKRLTKALKKKLITQEEFDVKLKRAKLDNSRVLYKK